MRWRPDCSFFSHSHIKTDTLYKHRHLWKGAQLTRHYLYWHLHSLSLRSVAQWYLSWCSPTPAVCTAAFWYVLYIDAQRGFLIEVWSLFDIHALHRHLWPGLCSPSLHWLYTRLLFCFSLSFSLYFSLCVLSLVSLIALFLRFCLLFYLFIALPYLCLVCFDVFSLFSCKF